MTDVAFVALGSNIGDRAAYLAFARDALAALPHTRILGASDVEETAPVGPVSQGPFLNQVVALETTLAPRELLAELQRIELAAGRTREERWGPRTLDLDIISFDRQRVAEPDLVVPHPELRNRDFWRRELDQARRAARQAPASRPAGGGAALA